MNRICYVVMLLSLMVSCNIENIGDVYAEEDLYASPGGISGGMSFSGVWDAALSSDMAVETGVTVVGDSVFVSVMPDARLFRMAFDNGRSVSDGECPEPEAWDVSGYAMRYVVTGNSSQTIVYGLDADDYTFRVKLSDGWHELTVRFAFGSGVSFSRYSGTFSLWLNVRSVGVDGQMVASYGTECPVLTLTAILSSAATHSDAAASDMP